MLKRKSFEKDLAEYFGRHTDTRTSAFLWPNGPGSFAMTTLETPVSKSKNFGLATGGFRMLSVHACEYPKTSKIFQTVN
jgi:hypothetical protein